MRRIIQKPMNHEAPEWVRAEADYFVTVCAESRGVNHFCRDVIGKAVIDSIIYRHEKRIWFCHLAVLMPDHIHMLVNFGDVPSIARVVGDWKHWLRHHHGIRWQENFFDHRIRSEENDRYKAEYILQNPVEAGLAANWEDWPYVFIPGR